MTEILLNAIIHLFAIFTFRRDRAFYPKAKELLEFYLKQYLGLSATCHTYLGLFTDFLDIYDAVPLENRELEKNIRKIVTELKKQLPRHEQYICLMLFTDLLCRAAADDPAITSDISGLASGFSIDDKTVADIEMFCRHPEDYEQLTDRFAVMAPDAESGRLACRTIAGKDFTGRFTIWFAEEIDSLFIRPGKDSRLLMSGTPLFQGHFYLMPLQATLHDPGWHAVNYAEIHALFKTAANGVCFSGEGLAFAYPGSDNGLHDFSFTTRGGQMVAVMGGSGSGKSTLLGLLTGSLPLDAGQVRINGKALHRHPGAHPCAHPDAFDGTIGYVPQDDLLFEDLTVYENLYYCARFCLADRSDAEIRARVTEVLKDLGQLDISHLRVGSPLEKTISGGQRKRLNIALELIREPAILFVDEPTSGLSSSDSETVMSLLKAQAIKGNLVFAVIHQPSSRIFKLFDRLWILDKGGWPVYDGTPLEGLVYFQSEIQQAGMEEYACPRCGNVNPEQIFAIIEAKKTDGAGRFIDERKISPEAWHKRYKSRIVSHRPDTGAAEAQDAPELSRSLSRPGLWGQFLIFFIRNLKSKLADRNYLVINLVEPMVLALFIGGLTRGIAGNTYVFRENTNMAVFFFISVIVSLFLGLSVSAQEINRDRKILVRERFLRLSWFSYISAKTVYLALVCALQTTIYVGIANTLTRVPDMYGTTWLMLFACGMVSSLLGLNVSASMKRAVSIYILIPVLLIPQMLLCGIVVDFDNLIDRRSGHRLTPTIADIMPSRWGVEALMVEQFTQNRYMRDLFAPESKKLQSEYMLDYFLPEMHALSDYLFLPDRPLDWEKESRRNLDTLWRETRLLSARTGIAPGMDAADFAFKTFDRSRWKQLREFLKSAETFFTAERRAAILEIARLKRALKTQGEAGTGTLTDIRNRYTNLGVERFALNDIALEAIRHSGTRLVQLIYPVSLVPENLWGRAQFMAPEKRLGSAVFSTYRFNLFVLCLMAAGLFTALYLNLFIVVVRRGRAIVKKMM
ncbi:MAG: ATP-binding cassette domain-containing protein [Desulfobacter sp.]